MKFCKICLKLINLKGQVFLLSLGVVAYAGFAGLMVTSHKHFTFRGIFLLGLGAKGLTALCKCACYFPSEILARCFSADVHLT